MSRHEPWEATWNGECGDQVLQTLLVASVLGPEGTEGALKPEAREESGCTVSWADDIEHGLLGLANETVGVSVDEGETWAGSPVTEKSVLDVVGGDVTLNGSVVLEENHRY